MASRLLESAVNRLEYVKLMTSCVVSGTPLHSKMISDCVVGIMQAVRNSRVIRPADALLLKTACENILAESEVCTIMAAVHAHVNLAQKSNTSSSGDKQHHHYLDTYQDEDDWTYYLEVNNDVGTKLMRMAAKFCRLGLYAATEPTFALGCAIALQIHRLEPNAFGN
jgi:hypothetical protein